MAPEKVFLKPGESEKFDGQLLVRNSNGRFIKPAGESLVLDTYLRRRIKVGDLVKAEKPKSKKTSNKLGNKS